MNYEYPKVTGGYRWVLLQRCYYDVGMEPVNVCDIGDKTMVSFSRELTTTEKAALDTLMADNPQHPPSGGVSVQIRDLWEERVGFIAATGLPNLRIFYKEAVAGSGVVNRIVLWHPTPLTTTQKTAVRDAYRNLWIG